VTCSSEASLECNKVALLWTLSMLSKQRLLKMQVLLQLWHWSAYLLTFEKPVALLE